MNTVLLPPLTTLAQLEQELLRTEQEVQRRQHAYIAPIFVPLQQPARYKGVFGGRGSGKSHAFADLVLDRCMARCTRVVCIREVQKSLEQSVKRLLEDKIISRGLGHLFRVLNTHIETPFGGIIIFQGMQNHTAESIKSLEGFDIAWVEEAQSLSERSLTLLRPTIRKALSELWFSWNPRHSTDPVDVFFRAGNQPPNAIVIEANYKDNPRFPVVLRTEMEWDKRRDADTYAHIWLGRYEAHSSSRVFKNWRVDEFDTPVDAKFLHGGDWGFSIDPTTLVRCYPVGMTLFIDAEVYQVGCEIDDTPALFDGLECGCTPKQAHPCRQPTRHGVARQWQIVADSARPETISYVKQHGYPQIVAAKKGKDSVKEGVIFLQSYDIVVHPRCIHTIDELTMYSYVVDPLTNVVTPLLADKKNHIIDPLRYAVEGLRSANGYFGWAKQQAEALLKAQQAA